MDVCKRDTLRKWRETEPRVTMDPARVFVDLTEKERVLQLAAYAAAVRGEAAETAAVVTEAKRLDDVPALTKHIFGHVASLLAGPDKGACPGPVLVRPRKPLTPLPVCVCVCVYVCVFTQRPRAW
jgi:hypothetical protein